jgi:hypothetical protein
MITDKDLAAYMAPRVGANTPTLTIPAATPVKSADITTPLQDATRAQAQDEFATQQELAVTPLAKSIGASIRNWDTVGVFNSLFNKPEFANDPQFHPNEALQSVGIPISEDDRDFLFKSTSQQEFDWRLSQLTDMRSRAQLAQASPIMNAVIQFADPLYLATDLLSAGAATAIKASRMATFAIGAASTAALQGQVAESRPLSENEVIMAAAMHGGATILGRAAMPEARKSLADMTPEEFQQEMVKRGNIPEGAQVDPTQFGSPVAMAAGLHVPSTPTATAVPKSAQAAAAKGFKQAQQGVGSQPKRPWLEFSLFKRVAGYSPEAQSAAERLLDDPLSPSSVSAASIHRELTARHSLLLNQYEDALRLGLAEDGWTNIQRFKDPVGYRRAQQDFEQAVRMELDHRMIDPSFRGANPRVAQAVDRLGEYSRAVGKELEASGMVEKGFVDKNPYYYPRRMNVTKLEQIEQTVGKKPFMREMTTAVQRGVGTDRPTANVIAYAMVERARRKGYGIDNSGHIVNKEGAQELLDIIKNAPGVDDAAKARASALLQPAGEDAGRAPMLKNRINIDMMHQIAPGVQVRDLFDDSITSMMDSYNRRINGRIALAQAGLGTDAERGAMIEAVSKSIKDPAQRRQAVADMENIFNYFLGAPVGEEMPQFMRQLSALTQATGLAASGLWQLVEYGTIMQRFGMVNTVKSMLRTMPEARALLNQMRATTQEGKQLALDVEEALTAQVAGDIRMRPVMEHYEDMFTADKTPWVMRMEHARDATMYVNLQKYIHFHQTRTTAALVTQTLRKAAEGDAKAIAAMQKYGATQQLLSDIRAEVAKSGTKLDAWDEQVFNRARVVMINAMDDAIVRARLGEIPAFAEFSTLGKFLFTFRRFVAATHNKTLVNTLNRDGVLGMATLMAYQYPLAFLATAANNVISGKGFDPQSPITATAGQALNYLGAIGFASEFTGVLTGQQRSFGAPGLLFLDRVYGVAGNVASAGRHALQGDGEKVAQDARQAAGNTLQALPLLSIVPGVRALTEAVKGD